jgi:type IV secretion system protein VirB9
MKSSSYLLAAIILGLATASPVLAADPRLLTRPYKAEDVVVVEGRAGTQATIVFGEDEHIENVAIGDSTSWQVTPNKRANLLFVKPLGPKARTNMTVVTDRHIYVFDLAASVTAAPFYVLRFTYPDEPKLAPVLIALTAEEVLAAANPPRDVSSPDASRLNFAWLAKGSKKLTPARIYDDGLSTYIAWPAGIPTPAILTRNEKGEEGPMNYAVRDDVLVLDMVPTIIVLRSGRESATLENLRKPGPAAASTGSTRKLAEISASTVSASIAMPPRPEGQ